MLGKGLTQCPPFLPILSSFVSYQNLTKTSNSCIFFENLGYNDFAGFCYDSVIKGEQSIKLSIRQERQKRDVSKFSKLGCLEIKLQNTLENFTGKGELRAGVGEYHGSKNGKNHIRIQNYLYIFCLTLILELATAYSQKIVYISCIELYNKTKQTL